MQIESFVTTRAKLQEVNVFSHVCHSVCVGVGGDGPLSMMHWISPTILIPPASPGPAPDVRPHCIGTPY